MATLLKKILTTLLLTAIFLLCSCDTETTDTHTDEKTQSPLVGTWETEESFNSQKGIKRVYEITSDNKFSYKIEYIYDVKPDGETVLIKKGEFVKISGNISITENKIIATDLKVSEESTISKDLLDEITKQTSNDREIEYKDLTELSVKIKDVYYDEDEDENEYEEWVTLKKRTNSNNNTGNSDNKNDNTESRIIGSWENTQTIDADGNSAEMKITYVISADKFTTIAEYNFMGTQITDTIDGTITKITDGTIYYTFVSPEDGITEAESVAIYKDLTADSVKFKGIDAYGNEVWLTFTKKTNTNNNDNKNDNTEYSIIGSWEGNYETTVMDGITMKMDATYTITDKSFTSTTKILEDVVIMDTLIYPAGHEQTSEFLITKIDTSAKLIGYKTTDPETNETKEDFIAYRNLTATTVEFMIPGMNGEPNWLTFTKVEI